MRIPNSGLLFEHFAQHDDILLILRPARCLFRPQDVLKARNLYFEAKHLKSNSRADEIFEPVRAAWLEDDVNSSGGGDQIPKLRARERRSLTTEGKPLRDRLGVHAGSELTQRGGEPIEILTVTCWRNVGVRSEPWETLESSRGRSHEHIANLMATERTQNPLRVECSHGVLRTAASRRREALRSSTSRCSGVRLKILGTSSSMWERP